MRVSINNEWKGVILMLAVFFFGGDDVPADEQENLPGG